MQCFHKEKKPSVRMAFSWVGIRASSRSRNLLAFAGIRDYPRPSHWRGNAAQSSAAPG